MYLLVYLYNALALIKLSLYIKSAKDDYISFGDSYITKVISNLGFQSNWSRSSDREFKQLALVEPKLVISLWGSLCFTSIFFFVIEDINEEIKWWPLENNKYSNACEGRWFWKQSLGALIQGGLYCNRAMLYKGEIYTGYAEATFVLLYQIHTMFPLSTCLLPSSFQNGFVPSMKLLLFLFSFLFQNISILYIKFQTSNQLDKWNFSAINFLIKCETYTSCFANYDTNKSHSLLKMD